MSRSYDGYGIPTLFGRRRDRGGTPTPIADILTGFAPSDVPAHVATHEPTTQDGDALARLRRRR